MPIENSCHDLGLANRAQFLAARQFSREVAAALAVEAARVFDALTYVPDGMLALLDSPEGWSALAEYISAELGAAGRGYQPLRH